MECPWQKCIKWPQGVVSGGDPSHKITVYSNYYKCYCDRRNYYQITLESHGLKVCSVMVIPLTKAQYIGIIHVVVSEKKYYKMTLHTNKS